MRLCNIKLYKISMKYNVKITENKNEKIEKTMNQNGNTLETKNPKSTNGLGKQYVVYDYKINDSGAH